MWCVLSLFSTVDLFLHRRRMLFIGSLCRGILLKFLCTSLVSLEVRESFPALFDDIMLLKPFLLACWLTSVCATEPHDYTLTLSTYWQTYCLSLGMFQQTIRVFIHPYAVLLPLLYFPWMQFPNRPIRKGTINCNCNICIYDIKLY